MKRLYTILFICFGLYALCISLYLLKGNLFTIPPEVQGTSADPYSFMVPEQVEKAESLSRINSLAFFLISPLQIGLLLLLLALGASARLRNRVEQWFRSSFLRIAAFVCLFLLLLDVLFLPVDYLLFRVQHAYGISNETIGMFFADHLKDYAISAVGAIVMAFIFYLVLKRSPRRWWLSFWVISIPLILFIQFISPVVLDPLYNNFQPLQNQELKSDILALAAKSNIPARQVYEVNMSERTNTINAYVNGIGGNARIVLWDTILSKLQKDEILSVMAHEMGHYVEKHIYWGILYGICLSLLGFWLSYHAYEYIVRRWGSFWGIHGVRDLAALPILLVLVTAMNFVSAPAQNAFSRVIEHRADMYEMKMTGNGDAAIRAFQKIAIENSSPVTQPRLVQWFRGSHPTIMERIQYFEQFKQKK
jgi:STE24 endopeptidase